MTDLPDFLRARLEEDETAARFVWPKRYTARVLAQCVAKWRIVELHREVSPGGDEPWGCVTCGATSAYLPSNIYSPARAWPCDTLRALALPYADHPDYREEWRPWSDAAVCQCRCHTGQSERETGRMVGQVKTAPAVRQHRDSGASPTIKESTR